MFAQSRPTDKSRRHNNDAFLEQEKVRFNLKWASELVETSRMSDFSILRTLSTSTFGKVVLAQYNKDIMVTVMAIKILEKKGIVKNRRVQQIMSEVKVMSCVRFPFIVPMEFYFKDHCYLYIGMPYIRGGKLFRHLGNRTYFSEEDTIFYSAQIIMAIEYLHYMGIIYRDIKPENILIDETGYVKLTDFAYAKKLGNSRTWTLCGKPEYLAPEVILSNGYNKTVDWWSLGILIFEMAAGYTPFFDKDVIKLYEKIVTGNCEFPTHFSVSLCDLLSKLIVVDRTKRETVTIKIKKHQFYETLDWDDIYLKTIVPNYKPKITGPADSSYFAPIQEVPLRTSDIDECTDVFKI